MSHRRARSVLGGAVPTEGKRFCAWNLTSVNDPPRHEPFRERATCGRAASVTGGCFSAIFLLRAVNPWARSLPGEEGGPRGRCERKQEGCRAGGFDLLVRRKRQGSALAPPAGPVEHPRLGGDAVADPGKARDTFLRTFPGALPVGRGPGGRPAGRGDPGPGDLGRCRRVTNLHRTARTAVEEHAGRIPSGPETLVALPGIGPHTMGAVACFAFEKDARAVLRSRCGA